jgi:hypothetical protein
MNEMDAVIALVIDQRTEWGTYMRAASKTASRVDSSDSFSFSNSVFASWRPLPTAAP